MRIHVGPRVPAHARAEHPGPYGTLGDPHMPPHARRGHLVAGNRHDAWEALPSVAAPTLVLHGDQGRSPRRRTPHCWRNASRTPGSTSSPAPSTPTSRSAGTRPVLGRAFLA
ncbi:hypothetical protein [Streptomyces sp. NPDC057287]|uniref:hypothetical protein n=1 Tax=Streptomyces sp. NPDC057287 TaxID=3346086 RepID=UPI00362F9AC2